jgi:hypothetical protein
MNYWLFEQISNNNNDRKPAFSVRAINNWYKALRFEIESAHGKSVSEQIESCRNFYSKDKSQKTNYVVSTSELFEYLFFSVVYCMTVDRFASELSKTPWIRPTAIVDWYYAIYFSLRSMLPIFGHTIPEDHSKVAKFVASTFRTHLPYPFDMLARRAKGEEYDVFLNGNQPSFYDLNQIFMRDNSVAQGMLAQYLRGTATWHVDRTKNAILHDKKLNIANFRSKNARSVRDNRLVTDIGFLHCAYRQRTKANYRDAIYLSYDYGEIVNLDSFISNLNVSAKFASIAAIACAEHNIGRESIKSFVGDLTVNMRGIADAEPSEKYWADFH